MTKALKKGIKLANPEKLKQEICLAIMMEPKGIPTLCDKYPHFPSPDTIYRWIGEDISFSEQYAAAKRAQITKLVDTVPAVIDQIKTPEEAYKVRIYIDWVKWIACKLAPKIYGDRIIADVKAEITHAEALKYLK